MREIKFRCFWKRSKIMEYDIESSYEWELMPINSGEDDNCVLMQYIGLKDRNGKEIYDGDILKNEYGLNKVVEWMSGQCCNYVATGYDLDQECCNYSWVAGNIYENKELLK